MPNNLIQKIARMVQPPSLRSEDYQPWSRGRGVDVWAMLCAAITGDLATVRELATRDPSLIECEYEYFKPLRFAVRENHRVVVDFLLDHGANPSYDAGGSLVTIARDRGYEDLATFLESKLKSQFQVDPEAAAVVAAIKSRDVALVRRGRTEIVGKLT